MTWWEKIGLKLALNWGIPMLSKLLPWVPGPVWEAISETIRHLAGFDDAELGAKAARFHDAVHDSLGTKCSCPSNPIK